MVIIFHAGSIRSLTLNFLDVANALQALSQVFRSRFPAL